MAVIIRIFDPPESGTPTFINQGMVTGATSVQLVERHYSPGYFSVQIPAGARHADRLMQGRLVYIDGAFWGIIDDVFARADSSGDLLTISGRQLKGMTHDRITLPPSAAAMTGAQGYDAQTGTTEAIMRHFVSANLGPDAAAGRQVYGLELASDQGRGIAEDKYMSRHEVLSDVLAALGEAGGLGYDIAPDLQAGKFLFSIVSGLDHSAGQSERTRVVFDLARKTALGQEYRYHTSDSRNVFYATMSGAEFADEALTVTYLRDGETEPVGIRRREQHLSLSADTPVAGEEYNELKRLALIEAEGYRLAESFTCDIVPAGRYSYRKDYSLGDLVTVRNASWGVTMHARLTEMESNYSADGVTLSATFGTAPLTVFGRMRRQINKRS